MKISKSVFRYIEYEMYSYDDIKKELGLYREEVLGGEEKPEVAVQGGLGDKTANKAIKLTSSKFVLQSERIINSIDRSLELLGDTYIELFRLKYQNGLPWQEVIAEMNVSDRTYYRLRRELVIVVGQQLGVINIE